MVVVVVASVIISAVEIAISTSGASDVIYSRYRGIVTTDGSSLWRNLKHDQFHEPVLKKQDVF